MDTEEIADAVPDGGDPPGHLIPQPRCKLGNTAPQSLDDVAADFHDFIHQRAEGFHDTRNDLRHGLDDLHDDGGQVFNQGNEQLNACHDDLIDVSDQCIDNAGDDLRNRLYDGRDDLRQSLYQRNQQVDACLNNERYRI